MTESKKILLFLMLCFNFVSGQSFQSIYLNSNDEIPLLSFDKPLDIDELLNEEIVKGQIFNFGKFVLCDINSDTKGSWTNVEDGKVWTLAIQAEEAKGISLYYDNFWIPSGGELYIYNPSQSQKIGPFTSKNNPASGVYATEIIYGDILILEYFQPNTTNNNLNLSINKFVYSYRDIISGQLGGYNSSENCQVNANCSEGNSWENQKKSVCRIQIGSGWNVGLCTGTLVNNTLNNCTPYVLSADHCFDGGDISENDLNQSIFYFNYLSPNCINSVPNNTYSITGCSYVSNSGGEGSLGDPDFFLVELNSDPEFDPYFSGWDRSNTPASNGVSIHHPSGDIMKISTFTNSLSSSSGLGFGFDNTTHWQVQWSQTDNGHGVTEGGSSGSPIYNQNSLLVGVLTGGSSFCDATNQTDIYGKLWHGWDQVGNSNSEQLKPWLDPNNSDVLSLNGMFCSETQNTICIDSTLINPSCICPLIYDPVCGCDGELYSNACEATQCFGVASYVSAFDANGNLIDCSTFSFEGCTDSNADNYNANALIDDGSCSYCSEIANDIIVYDASSVLECNGAAISTPSGGFPPYTFNWNGNEGNNITTICSGNNVLTITDSIGCELVDTFFVGPVSLGCIDFNACNFSEIANTDDGSCIFPDSIYDCFGNCYNDSDLDGVCDELEINGCTNENAPNYNMFATDDDGSCIECNISVEYILYNSSSNLECNGLIGLIINNQVDYTAYVNNEALNTNYYTEACFGQNEILIEDDLGCIYSDTINIGANSIYGCTSPLAINYNPSATINDSSCEFSTEYSAQWQAFGPTQVPLQNNGTKRGVGRVSNITLNSQNDSVIWVSTPSGGLWKSEDNGNSWSTNTDFLPNLGMSDVVIDPTNPNIMYFISGDRDADDTYAYGLMKSTDGGESWNSTGLSFNINSAYRGNRILINPNNTNILIVSTRKSGYGETFRSTDGGQNWELVLQGPNLISMEFNPTNSNHIYAVTTGTSKYYRSFDNGVTWSNATNDSGLPNSGNTRAVVAVTPANPNVVYILYSAGGGGFGGLYKSTDGGYNFTLQSNSPNILSWEVDGSGADGQGTYDLALAVSPTNEDIVFTGGINIWKSINGGVDFNISSHWYGADGTEYVHANQHIIKFNSTGNVLYSGNGGGIYQSNDFGNSWHDISDGLQITQFNKIGISQTDYGLLLGGAQGNGTLRCNSENDWDAVRGGDGMECAIDPTDPSIMYSEVYYGAISISTNGGQNWNNIAPDSDGGWITPYEIDQNNPNRIVIGYNYMYESLDYGSSWDTISSNFSGNIDVIALSTNSDVIYTSETEEIYKTIDGGQNWTNISAGLPNNSITDIVLHPTNENRVWITLSGYSSGDKVFYSDDGGENWINISDGLLNLPTNCILFYQPNETLFVGTDVGVFYKDNTMAEWEMFNQGLPNVIVNELEYHINSNKLFAATYGRGVWVCDLATGPPIASFNYSIIDECSGLVDFNNTSFNSTSVEWFFGDNSTSTENNSSHQYQIDGSYEVKLVVTNDLGTDTISQILTIDILDTPTALSFDIVDCGVDSYDLSISNDTNFEICWFEDSTYESILHIGNTYTINYDNLTDNLYYSYLDTISHGSVGPSEYEGNNEYSGSSSSVGSLVFDAYESFILESVDVYTNQAGERKIILLDDNDNKLQEHNIYVPVSDNIPFTINLNFYINPGINYKLATDNEVSIANFGGENPQLKRTSNAVPLYFPYNYNNTLSITSSFWGNETLTDYYYYFYNWNVKEICLSPKSEIILNVDTSNFQACGCMDTDALNYNQLAIVDDGSCEYEVLENPCDIIPSGMFVDNIIHNRVNFNWSQPEVSPSHYMIRYRPVGTSSWTVMTAGPVNNNPFNGTSRTRYFMEPETNYEWNIRARVLNEDGSTNCQSPWSASSQFATLPACPNLENLSVSTEANWVTLNADAPGEEWGVWQSKAKMKELGTNSFRYANGDSYGNINVLKGNFSPNTEYQWHTKAWCTGNVDELGNSDPQYHSSWGDFSYFTTEEICNKMPVNLSTSSNGANTAITMSWDLPLSGTPDHYFLELNNENTGQQWLWNSIPGSQTSKSKFGLTQGEYSWRIRGACGTNGTTWATIFSEPVYYTLGGARFDNDIVSDLNVYPNPSRDLFNISFSSDELQSISIRVVNVIGEEIFKDKLTDFDGKYSHELDMSKKSKGVYFLEISSEKGTVNSKMVLQ